ncbi:hypothetical protein LINGRAHAP2_LOCUS17912, partial [Linum grandiflorum]
MRTSKLGSGLICFKSYCCFWSCISNVYQ